MTRFRPLKLLLLAWALSACSLTDVGYRPMSTVYCDNFMIYDMCAEDLDSDGVVEYVFFADTQDVFMYREGVLDDIPSKYDMHRCAQPMDDDLVATTSRVFYVDEETTYLEKQDIRGAMMIKYISYMPKVTACNMRADQAAAGESGS